MKKALLRTASVVSMFAILFSTVANEAKPVFSGKVNLDTKAIKDATYRSSRIINPTSVKAVLKKQGYAAGSTSSSGKPFVQQGNQTGFINAPFAPTCTMGEAVYTYNASNPIRHFDVPDNVYSVNIKVVGANGGDAGSAGQSGGIGYAYQATYTVSPTDVLSVMPGQRGSDESMDFFSASFSGGGGGGSFVSLNDAAMTDISKLMVAAGGGGGASFGASADVNPGLHYDINGSASTDGMYGSGGLGSGSFGTGGMGGDGAASAGGGSGFSGDGLSSPIDASGKSALNGWAGGINPSFDAAGSEYGGFGGGGAQMYGGGGGGGYSGGGGGDYGAYGGGGGSYITAHNRTAIEEFYADATKGLSSGDGLIVITWTIPKPAISVFGNSNAITNGQTAVSVPDFTDFGNLAVGGSVPHVFEIKNTGTQNLVISTISVSNTTDFGVSPPVSATIIPGGVTTFTASFHPTSAGGKTGTVVINNNDGCTPAYTFVIAGNGTVVTTTPLVPGEIGVDQTVCADDPVNPVVNTTGASGGTGTINYQWQSKTGAGTFTDIPGATSQSYSPPVAAVTISYRRGASTTTDAVVYSNTVTVTVNPLPSVTAGSNSPICAGQTINLTSTPASSYHWTGPDGFISTDQNPSIANATVAKGGTYIVKIEDANGCRNTASVNVAVNALPDAPVGAAAERCGEGEITVFASGINSDETVIWYAEATGGAPIGSGETYTSTISATTTYYAETKNTLTGCISATRTAVTATVNSNPDIAAVLSYIPRTLCLNSPIQAPMYLPNVSFSTNPSGIVDVQNFFYELYMQPLAIGTTTLAVTMSNAYCSVTESIQITVNPSPVVTLSTDGPATACANSMVLHATPGGTAYYWLMDGFYLGETSTPSYTATETGTHTYSVTMVSETGCSGSASLETTLNLPAVIGGTPVVCVGNTTQLTGSGTPATVNPWTSSDPLKATISSTGVVTGLAQGAVIITYNNRDGCSASITVTVNPGVTPTFAQVAPICSGTPLDPLPTTSINHITGSWLPALNNAATTTYTFTPDANQCASGTTMTIVVNTPPAAPTVSGPTQLCLGYGETNVTVTAASPAPGAVFHWYDQATGGNLLASTAAFTTPSLTVSTNYWVDVTNSDGCTSARTRVLINVKTFPLQYTVSGTTTLCPGGGGATITLSNSEASLTYLLKKDDVTIDNRLGTGSAMTYPGIIAPGTYTIVAINGGCANPMIGSAVITIGTNNSISLSSGAGTNAQTICINSPVTNIRYATTGATGATFSGLPAGVTGSWSANVATISGTPTVSGTYNYTVTLTGGCGTVTATGSIIVTAPVTPTFTQVAAICSGELLAPLPTTSINNIPGIWSPALNNTATTTYTFTPNAGQCANSTTMTIVVNALPAVSVNPVSTTICAGGSTTLNATSGGGGFPGLLGYWKFNEVSGTTAADASGNNLTATFQQGSGWAASGAFAGAGNAATFGGRYMSVNDNALFNTMSSNFTLEAWIYQTDGINNTIIDRGDYNFLFQSKPNGQPGLGFYNNGSWTYSTSSLPTNTWVHVACTWDGSTIRFYTNGVLTDAISRGPLYFGSGGPVNIGRQSPYSCACNLMDGSIDELRVWNVTKSSAQISAAMGSSLSSASFVWSPATGLNTTTGATVTASPSSTTVYTVTATNAAGCTATANTTVTVNANVTPTFTQVAAICSGASLAALPTTSNNGIPGTWYPALNNTATTTYTFTPNAGQCATTATITITVNALPTISGTLVACVPTGRQLTGSGTPAPSNPWTSSNTSIATVSNTGFVTAVAAAGGSVVITYTDANGCSATANFTVPALPPTPTVSVVDNCDGTSTLTASGYTDYQWYDGVSVVTGTSITVSTAGTYSVRSASSQCVSPWAYGTAAPKTTPVATISAGGPTTFCAGGLVVLTSSSATGNVWSPGGATTQSITVTASGYYTVTVTDGPCSATSAPTTVTVNTNVTPTFTQVAAICSGGLLAALPTTSINGIPGTWYPALNNTATTTYTFTPDAGQCATTATMTITVNANPTISGTLQMCPLGTVTLTGSGTPAVSNAWTSSHSFIAAVSQTGVVTAGSGGGGTNITYTDINGCSNTVLVFVNARPNPTSNIAEQQRCGTGTVNLAAFGFAGQAIDWYDAATGGNMVFTGNGFTTPSISVTTTYYVETRNTTTGCVSATRTAVTATVNPLPAVAVGTDATRCGPGVVTLTATAGAGETIDWYLQPVGGGGSLASGTGSFNVSIGAAPGTVVRYAEVRNLATGCVSATRTAVTGTATALAPVLQYASTPNCDGSINVSVTNATGPVVWTPGNISGSSIIVTQTGTYSAIQTVNGCTSPFAPFTVTTLTPATAFAVSGGGAICFGGSGAVISLSGSETGVLYTLLHNGNPFISQNGTGAAISFNNINAAGTYTISAQKNGFAPECIVSMTGSVNVTVNTAPTITQGTPNKAYNTEPGNCSVKVVFGLTYGMIYSLGSPAGTFTYTLTGATTGSGSGSGSGTFFNKGITHVTYTLTNSCGSVSTSYDITVTDNEAPVVPVLLDVTGQCSATATTPTTTDNCAGTVTGTTNDPLTYTTQGDHVIHWTFTDGTNTSYAVQHVIVTDNIPPVLTCPDNINVNADVVNGEGVSGAYANYEAIVTDNCAATISYSIEPGSFFAVGTHPVVVTAVDAGGNTISCTFNVTVSCATPVFTVTPENMVVDAEASSCTAKVGFTIETNNLLPTDLVYVLTGATTGYGSTLNAVVFNVGVTTVTVTATTSCGSTAQYSFTVTVEDHSIPYISCQPVTLVLDENGHAVLDQSFINTLLTRPVLGGRGGGEPRIPTNMIANVYENCGIASIVFSQNNFDCSNLGSPIPVTITITDVNGNIATCNTSVSVVDEQEPVITAPANIIANTLTGTCVNDAVALGTPTTSDNCTVTITNNAPLSFQIGTTTVIWTVTDAAGNESSAEQTVTILDREAPRVPVLADVTGECSASATTPTTTDNCDTEITGTTEDALTYTTQGTHVIHWTFTDANGNSSYANQNVIVKDVTPPVPVCPANKIVIANTTLSNASGAYVTYAATATDNCSTPTLSYSPASGDFFAVGTHTVTVTAVDAVGNTATCTFDVTVNNMPIDAVNDDYTSTPINGAHGGTTPVVLTNDLLNNAAVSISDINLTLLNNGGIAGLSFDAYGALIVPAGTWEGDYTVSYRICEKANPSNCDDATVIIRIARGLKLTAYTYCNNDVPYVHYKVVPNFTPDANPVTITWFNGNMTPVVAQTITAGMPLEGDMLWPGAVLDVNGQPIDWPGWYIDNGVWVQGADGFEGTRPTAYVQISVNPTELIEVSYPPATPLCNSVPTNRPPVANPDSKTIEKCGTATIDVVANDTDFEMGALTVTSVSTPAHGTVVINGDGTLTYTPVAGFVGTDNFTYAIVDAAGLTATTTVTITVVDTTAPIVPSLSSIVEECAATVPEPTAADGCGGFVTGVPNKPLSYTEQGEYDIIWTFTDASGNTSTATQHVSVKDVTKPIPVCPANITVAANTVVSGTSGRYVTYAATATDNCSTPTLSYSPASGDFFAVGTHTITVTAVDAAGNTATCTFDVTVNNMPIDAVNDDYTSTPINGAHGGTTPVVLTNDLLNNAAVSISDINLTLLNNGGIAGLSFDAYGALIVPAGTWEGDYTVSYRICEKANPSNCDDATVIIRIARGLKLTAYTYCNNDVPYVHYKVVPNFTPDANPVTITWFNGNMTPVVAQTITAGMPLEGDMLWPGAVLDVNGQPIDWPGWYIDNGVWVQGDDGFEGTRPTAYVQISVNPTELIEVSYPPATPLCNSVPTNRPPVANPDSKTIEKCGTATIDVVANDTDFEMGALTVTSVSTPAHGTVVINGDGTLTYTPAAGFVGTDYFTYVVTDAAGLTATTSVTVIVEDTIVPTAPELTTVTGECAATAPVPVATDGCSGTISGTTDDALTYNTPGDHVIRWTFTDASGNSSYAEQHVIIEDVTKPIPVCPANITVTANTVVSGTSGRYVTYAATATDNCSIPTLSYSRASGDFFAVGTHTITVTAIDAAGNTATCTFDVTVDCVKPTITCPAPVTVNTANGVCTAPVNYEPTISYGLPVGTVSYVFTGATTGSGPGTGSGATFRKGVTTVTITVSNICGSASRSFTITVVDNQNPTIFAPSNVTVSANAYCQATGVDLGTPATGDNCGVQSVVSDAPSIFPIGTTTVTWTVTDVSGRTSTATQTVTVVDNTAPVVSCPSDMVLTANTIVSGVSGANATYTATATDNCGAVTVYYSIAPGSFFPIGTTPVTVTAKDAKGNTSTCTFNVVVNCVKPSFTSCPSAVTANTVTTGCYATVAYNVTIAAGLPAATVSYTLSGATTGNGSGTGTGLNFNKGVTTVTITATNICGTVSKTFNVTVADQTAPVIVNCPANTTVYCGGSTLPAATGTATATDNCGTVTVTYTDVVNANNTITRTWKATDAAYNSSTCTQTITTGGTFTATVASIPTSNTFTGGAANSLFIGYGAQSTKLQVSVPSTGGPYTYTWGGSATGMLSSTTSSNPVFTPTAGNSYTFTVLVKNAYGCSSTAVITICVTDIRVMSSNDDDDDEQTTCDHRSHDYSDCAHRGHNHSCNHRTHSKYDCSHRHDGDDDDDRNCDHRSHNSSDCSHRGHNHASCDHRSHSSSYCDHNKRTYGSSQKVCDHKSHSSRDCNHNSHHHNSCSHNSHSSSNCSHNESGHEDGQKVYICHVPPGNANNPLTLSISINAVADHLANHPGDRLGSCAQQPCSPFVDTEKPEIECPPAITVNYGSSTAPSATGSATATDNSNVVTITNTDASTKGTNAASASYYNYTITRTWKATDATGNVETCTQIITVKDVTKPVISCPGAITVTCSNVAGTSNTGTASATDNSGGTVTITYSDYTSGTTITRTWKATDVCGNYATCTQAISVVDDIKPVISCPANTTVNCGASTSPSYCGNGASATATDNCDNNVSISYSDYKSGNVITRTWKATDDAGNFSTCTQTITIIDTQKPVISCPGNITVSCGSNTTPTGCNSIATATDNCDNSVAITFSDITSGNVITRTWRAQDDAGNYSTCIQKITIVDNTAPSLTEPNDITVSCGTSTLPAVTGNASATDNCSAVTIWYTDAVSGNKITRTWQAKDVTGNTSTDVQIITIADNTKPAISDVADVTLNCGGSTAPAATGTATASDNCSTATVTYSDATNGNVITRTWKATDAAGNYSTSTQSITVGSPFSPNITSVPTTSTYTGGIATNLYLGYGAQSTKLEVCALPSSGAPYTYTWSGAATSRLSSTTSSAPVFTPNTYGSFTFTVSVKNKFGCTYTDYITICVTDIRVGTNGSKVYVCNTVRDKYGRASKQTLQVAISQVASYINSSNCDNDEARLGSCDQTPCNYTGLTTASSTVKQGVTSEGGVNVKTMTTEEELKVTVMPNPSTTFFTLKLESKYETPVNLRVMDGSGRVVDARTKLGANSTLQIGHNYSSGTYYAELIQGGTRKVVQLIKARG